MYHCEHSNSPTQVNALHLFRSINLYIYIEGQGTKQNVLKKDHYHLMDRQMCDAWHALHFRMQFVRSINSIKHVTVTPWLTIYGCNTPTPYPYLIWGKWMKKYVSPKICISTVMFLFISGLGNLLLNAIIQWQLWGKIAGSQIMVWIIYQVVYNSLVPLSFSHLFAHPP